MDRAHDSRLTPRQRDVLRLIARGHTNGEIADLLGISLAGVKWHVSELLGKLGVDSRDDLAELWERKAGVASRVRRWAGGMVPSFSLKVVAGAVASVGVAMALASVTILSGRGDNADAGKPDAAATAEPTPTPIFSIDEARARAYELAEEEIDATDSWDNIVVSGRALRATDLYIADEQFVPDATTVRSRGHRVEWRGGQGEDVWAFTLELRGLDLPGTDGAIGAFLIFEDGTGVKNAGSLSGPTPLDPPLGLRFDYETATTLASVTVVGREWTLKAQETEDGTECLLWNDPRVPGLGARGAGCGKPFPGNWRFIITPAVEPGGQVFWGAVGDGIEVIRLTLADGSTQLVEPKPLPPELPFGWRYFLVGIEGDVDVMTANGLAADGTVVESHQLGPFGDRALPKSYPAQPSVDTLGTGPGPTGDLLLVPGGIPKLFVDFRYEGLDPVSVELVCDTGETTFINHLQPGGVFETHAIVDIPGGATACHYEVRGAGSWSLRSR